ncbi:dolichol-phosphate mannosyltransferase, putative [Plasmodium ovale curtisi]|uniref:Dolichol-phosphate mannosyltransferase subunit 1 n=1 Tax=Plasmodium ovale curtisi TaxID=864141 RepID=A0A1A8WJL6_PLAOA|nr:dolichol-phosphate mannosyltransferase, putative [Plasmodium ovale curtisi]
MRQKATEGTPMTLQPNVIEVDGFVSNDNDSLPLWARDRIKVRSRLLQNNLYNGHDFNAYRHSFTAYGYILRARDTSSIGALTANTAFQCGHRKLKTCGISCSPHFNQAWPKELNKKNIQFEIILVDDNSEDNTADVYKKLQSIFKEEKLLLLERKGKYGLGSAYIDALKIVSGMFVIIMDADLSHHPKYIYDFIKRQKETNCDIVTGTRYNKNGGISGWTFKRVLISRVANFLSQFLLFINLTDLTGSFRLYKTEVLQEIINKVEGKGYVFQMEVIVRANKMGKKIEEVGSSGLSKGKEAQRVKWKRRRGKVESHFSHVRNHTPRKKRKNGEKYPKLLCLHVRLNFTESFTPNEPSLKSIRIIRLPVENTYNPLKIPFEILYSPYYVKVVIHEVASLGMVNISKSVFH